MPVTRGMASYDLDHAHASPVNTRFMEDGWRNTAFGSKPGCHYEKPKNGPWGEPKSSNQYLTSSECQAQWCPRKTDEETHCGRGVLGKGRDEPYKVIRGTVETCQRMEDARVYRSPEQVLGASFFAFHRVGKAAHGCQRQAHVRTSQTAVVMSRAVQTGIAAVTPTV